MGGRSRELFELVGDYFDNSLRTLDFCTSLDKCLKHARDIHSMIVVALDQFEEEMKDHRVGGKYVKTLEELRKFKAAGDPFTEEFFSMFRSVYDHQMMMLGKLHLKKNKLDKKLKHINSWRKVILSLGSTGKWIDSLLLKKYGRAMKGQEKLVSTMLVGTCAANKDMGSIRMLLGRLEMELGLIQMTGFAIDQGRVKLVLQEMKKEVGVLMKNVDDLRAQADNCSRDITRARTAILQRITKIHNDIYSC